MSFFFLFRYLSDAAFLAVFAIVHGYILLL